MAKIQSKVVPSPRNIYIDNFEVSDSGIIAYCLIDDQDIDFNINKDDFETFCDEHEMRDWCNDTYTGWSGWTEDNGTTPWDEIYNDRETMYKFLKAYITHLYDMEAMDIETPIHKLINA